MNRRWLPAETINRIAADPAHQMQEPPATGIDLSRPFVPEDYTQLYFTPLYRQLEHRHRLRYNQLFGVRINEYIMMLEADLVERVLRPLMRHPRVAGDAALVAAAATMIEEEKQHYQIFLNLNRRCMPEVFAGRHERYFSRLPLGWRVLQATIGVSSRWLAFPLWYLMAMEESSTALARDMARSPETETLGPLEPSFVAVHREHMKDEARHLHIDAHLIETCLAGAGGVRRQLNARLFKRLSSGVTRVGRTGSGVKVIRHLVREHPELKPEEENLIRAILRLTRDESFQRSLFNRRAMPLTFSLFDQAPELERLGEHMVGYDRH